MSNRIVKLPSVESFGRPTNEEIEAGAKAFYEALKPDSYPQWDSDCALRAEYYDAMRLAVKAMQGKATEE